MSDITAATIEWKHRRCRVASLGYNFDQESRLIGAAGYTYTYDGNRAKKSNGSTGTLYWYMAPGVVAESDLAGFP